jgi:pimeloyl-ACP methyl ester carboxylesterase
MAHSLIFLLVILCSILLIGILVIVSRYTREIKVARQRLDRLGSQVVETTCGSIEYARVGEGYPVLVVHGAMGGFDQGLWLANGFDITKYQVISVSRFGYLRSPLPAGANLDRQADALDCLLDTLEIQQAAVFAVSAGATSAIRFAARHPERVSALILLGPDAPGEVQMAMPPRFVFDTLLRSDFVYWVLVTFFGKWVQNAIGLVPKGYVLTPEQEAMLKMIQLGDLPVSQRVDIIRDAVTWTPLYGRASPTFQVIFASDGDVTWRDTGTVFMSNDIGPVVRLYGTFEQADSTYGLLSRPAYIRLLNESAAEQIVKSLSNALERPAG